MNRDEQTRLIEAGAPVDGDRSFDKWLPELEAIPFRICGPAEATVVGVVDLLVDDSAGSAQLVEHGVEVSDSVIDHERFLARREILRIGREG